MVVKMDIDKLVKSLHSLERKVLPFISENINIQKIIEKSGLKDVEVMRALQWLENKNIISVKEKKSEVIFLDTKGVLCKKDGFPERKVIDALKNSSLSIKELEKKTKLSIPEINASIGSLKSNAAVDIEKKENSLILSLTDNGKKFLNKKLLEEKFLDNNFPVEINKLKPEEKLAVEKLKKGKKIIKQGVLTLKDYSLTDLGKKVVASKFFGVDLIDSLTPAMLRDSSWNKKEFRRFDVDINVPKIFGGKKQWYRKFLDETRDKFASLGFEEMQGPVVESDFWNMDSLFMPQFHSARDIHDAFYIKEPKYAKLPKDLVEKVKNAHETGADTGSFGWRYSFDVNRTHQQLLRTQTTACSARKLASKDLKIPGKYFAIAPCFRRDVVDATHLNNFFQIEGFVIEENLTIRHLFGMLELFAKEIAQTEEYRIITCYFPFTEPSASLLVKHKEMGWIELGGAGIFRPELVIPLVGKNITVIAWGLGIDRLAMFKHNVKDIRTVFTQDINYLRIERVL